jgi:BioD-like phosphotransacetylase family protein
MTNLYVTSAETYSGKSALCIGLGIRFKADGLRAGYMKPVNVNSQLREGVAYDDDVVFARQVFDMPESPTELSPVAFTPARLTRQLRGPEVDYEQVLMEAFAKVSEGRDVLVLEGGRDSHEGYIARLPAGRVVELLDARALLVLKYNDTQLADRALEAQAYFGSALIGVVINEAPPVAMDDIREAIIPFMTRHNLPVLGTLPMDPELAAPTVAELADGLHADILAGNEQSGELVEHMMVGAMRAEAALAYFRRIDHKAVITGGDRADIQMAALQTSTRCLILSGNLYPSPAVLYRAKERGVPVLLTDLDSFAAAEIVGSYIGRSRFQQPQKVERFTALLNGNMDFAALYESLDIKPR